ncbi:MAG: adenosine deaminase [Acidobacteriota bacterium]
MKPIDLVAQVRRLPKVELHLHLEGSVRIDTLMRLAKRHRTELAGLDVEAVRTAVYAFSDFRSFLASFRQICLHLRDPRDYIEIFRDLQAYLTGERIRYAEVIYSPAIPWRWGRDGREILMALLDEATAFEERSGIRVRWILDCVRQFGRAAAEQTAELAVEFQPRGVVGLGLGGDELSVPAEEFREVFAWARAHQVYTHIHAGEVGDPASIWEALQILGANRIGHGIQAARDGRLMEYLRERAVGLDVCLTSNVRTRAWPMLGDHPLGLLLRRGVPVSLNTDDPGLFETTLGEEFAKAVQFLGLGWEELVRVLLQGVRSSFLPHEEKMQLMQEISDAVRSIHEADHPDSLPQ